MKLLSKAYPTLMTYDNKPLGILTPDKNNPDKKNNVHNDITL